MDAAWTDRRLIGVIAAFWLKSSLARVTIDPGGSK